VGKLSPPGPAQRSGAGETSPVDVDALEAGLRPGTDGNVLEEGMTGMYISTAERGGGLGSDLMFTHVNQPLLLLLWFRPRPREDGPWTASLSQGKHLQAVKVSEPPQRVCVCVCTSGSLCVCVCVCVLPSLDFSSVCVCCSGKFPSSTLETAELRLLFIFLLTVCVCV